MPDGLGSKELVERLQEQNPELKAILMSRTRSQMPEDEFESKRTIRYIFKPLRFEFPAALGSKLLGRWARRSRERLIQVSPCKIDGKRLRLLRNAA